MQSLTTERVQLLGQVRDVVGERSFTVLREKAGLRQETVHLLDINLLLKHGVLDLEAKLIMEIIDRFNLDNPSASPSKLVPNVPPTYPGGYLYPQINNPFQNQTLPNNSATTTASTSGSNAGVGLYNVGSNHPSVYSAPPGQYYPYPPHQQYYPPSGNVPTGLIPNPSLNLNPTTNPNLSMNPNQYNQQQQAQKMEEERKREEQERKRKEEEERRRREEEERRKREEEERRKREEEERKKREEEERKKKELEERNKRIEELRKKMKQDEEQELVRMVEEASRKKMKQDEEQELVRMVEEASRKEKENSMRKQFPSTPFTPPTSSTSFGPSGAATGFTSSNYIGATGFGGTGGIGATGVVRGGSERKGDVDMEEKIRGYRDKINKTGVEANGFAATIQMVMDNRRKVTKDDLKSWIKRADVMCDNLEKLTLELDTVQGGDRIRIMRKEEIQRIQAIQATLDGIRDILRASLPKESN